jgi:hypothetical protein
MRVRAGHLGMGQTISTSQLPGYTGLTCGNAGGTWIGSSAFCQFSSIAAPSGPSLPSGYDPTTGTVDPTNTIGQTLSNLPANSGDLCIEQGGTWDGVTCNQSNLCSLPLGVYNESTGACDYTELYLAVGGVAVLALLIAIASGGGESRRRK